MKKILSFIMVIILLLSAFSACSNPKADDLSESNDEIDSSASSDSISSDEAEEKDSGDSTEDNSGGDGYGNGEASQDGGKNYLC